MSSPWQELTDKDLFVKLAHKRSDVYYFFRTRQNGKRNKAKRSRDNIYEEIVRRGLKPSDVINKVWRIKQDGSCVGFKGARR